MQLRFDGVSTGARKAANETRTAVKSVGDTADRETKRISLMGPALRRTFSLAAVGLTLFAGASVVAMKKSIDAASNLTEQINKANVVFRGSEKIVIAWSETTAKSIGISQRAALEFAGVFGNMLVPMGFARDEAAKMSTQLVELAADMASFNNASPEEVLEAIRAGLAGETEPLRRFGIFLSEARIQQMALNEGLVQGKEKLTSAGKAAAIYRIILKDTGDAQGDFARTSDNLANSQRTTRAVLEDVAARLGKVFLPAVTAASNALNRWLQDESNVRMLERWAETLQEGVATALRGIADWVSAHRVEIVSFFRDTASFAASLARAAGDVAGAVGGWGEAFKLVISGALALKLASILGILGGAKGTGAGGIVGMLTRLKALGPISVFVTVFYAKKWLEDATGEKLWGDPDFNAGNATIPVRGKDGIWRAADGTPVKDQAYWEKKYAAGQVSATKGTAPRTGPGSSLDRASRPNSYLTTPSGSTYGGLQSGALTLAGFVERSGGTISAGREGGHSSTGGHGVGQSLDIRWANNGPRIWAALFPHRAKFRLLLGPPGLFMWGRPYQNERDRKNHQDHIHVQYQGSAAELHKMLGDNAPEITGAQPDPTKTPSYDPTETSADTSAAATAGSSATKATVDSDDLRSARGTATFINKHLESIASPTLRARIRQRGLKIAEILGDVTDPKEFARAKRNLAALERDFENAVKLTSATKEAQKSARNIGVALGRMPEAMQKELGPRLAQIDRDLGNVTSKRQLDGIRRRMEELNKIIAAGVAKMVETVERRRDAFGRAFGVVADKALAVFDAKTDELIRLARAKVGGELLGEGDLGPAGRALAEFRAAKALADRARSRTEALGAAETPEDRARLEAEHAIEDQELALEQAAAVEERAIAEGLERDRARIRDERTMLKERFDARLAVIRRGLDEEGKTAEWAQQQLLALMADPEFAADFADAGRLIGEAFADSFRTALAAVADAVNALRAALTELAGATGKAPPGGNPLELGPARFGTGDFRRLAGFATGGRVPGRFVGRDDTVMARVTPGEYVLDRSLSRKLEQALAGGGLGGMTLVDVHLQGSTFLGANDQVAVAIADAIRRSSVARMSLGRTMTDEQERQVGYRSIR